MKRSHPKPKRSPDERRGAARRKTRGKSSLPAKSSRHPRKPPPARLLAGGNPQIAKGDGDAPVQAYIAAMPGWKRAVGERLDALIERTVPGVRKAVKWNSPFYGVGDQGWFVSFHVFARYVKVAFFRGASLTPRPPGPSRSGETRYVDLSENDAVDDARMESWIRQAAALPGWLG